MAILYDSYTPPAALTAFARSVPLEQQYTLNQILPDRVDNIIDVEVSAELTSTTRAAKARAWDAPPMPGRRDGFMRTRVSLPPVSQFLSLGEKDKLEIQRMALGGTNNSAIIDQIYRDTLNNVRSVQARVELMRGDVLADGIVTVAELGVEADYGVPGPHKVTAGVLWSDHTTPILDVYRGWCDTYQYGANGNGFGPGGQYMSRQVLNHILRNEEVRSEISGENSNGTPAANIVALEQLNSMFLSYGIPPVLGTYDAKVDQDGSTVNVLPADRIIFTPPAGISLGYTQWGMTTTGLELAGSGLQVDSTPAGMVAVVDKDPTPPYRETSYVDATALPVIERPRSLFVAKVL